MITTNKIALIKLYFEQNTKILCLLTINLYNNFIIFSALHLNNIENKKKK